MNMDISQDVYKVVPEYLYPVEEIQNRTLLKNMKIIAVIATAATVFTIIYVYVLANENKKLKSSNQNDV